MRWVRLAVVNQREACAASATKLEMFPNVLSFPCPSIQNLSLSRTQHCQDKRRKGIDRYSSCSPTLFLVAGSPFGTNVVRPLSSQIYIVRTTKIAGASLQNTSFPLCCLNVLILLRVLNVLRVPRDHATPTFPSLKVKVYNVKVKVYNVKDYLESGVSV